MTDDNIFDRDGRGRDARERDEQVRARLRAADPAASLGPADPAWVARMTRAAMSEPSTTSPVHSLDHRPGRLPMLVAAAAVVVAGGLGLWSVLGSGEDSGPLTAADPAASGAPTESAPSAAPEPLPADGPTTLSAPPAVATKCMVPNADVLRRQDLAFAGTVTAVDGLAVDLTTTRVYAGDVADTVQVQAPSAEMSVLLSAVQFEVGTSYLVSATDGQVTLCGFSAEATPELSALYAEAYGG